MVKILAMVGALVVLAPWRASAQPVDYPELGSWRVDLAKSQFPPGLAPQEKTYAFEATPAGFKETIHTRDAQGHERTSGSTYRYDGKMYAFTGYPLIDAIAIKRLDRFRADVTFFRGGKVVGRAHANISRDARTITFAENLQDRSGRPMHIVEVLARR